MHAQCTSAWTAKINIKGVCQPTYWTDIQACMSKWLPRLEIILYCHAIFLCCKTEYLPVAQRESVSGFCHETLINLIHTSPTSLPNLCMHFFVLYTRQIKYYGNYYTHSSTFCLFQLNAHIHINNYLLCHSNFSCPTCFDLQRSSSVGG